MNGTNDASGEGLSQDFCDFIDALSERKVDVVLVGGYAVGIHGVTRATNDIDFMYRRTTKNVRSLMAALTEFGAPSNIIDEAALMEPDGVTQFGSPPNRIDLVSEIDGVTFQAVRKGAITAKLGNRKLLVIGLSELLANKRAAGREQDLSDVRALEARHRRKAR